MNPSQLRQTDMEQTLTYAEAIARFGSSWVRTEDGYTIREQLGVSGGAVGDSRAAGVERVMQTIRTRRGELERQIEYIKREIDSHGGILGRVLFNDILVRYRADLADRQERLARIPDKPTVEPLLAEADSNIPVSALKPGRAIWFVNTASGGVWSENIVRITFLEDGLVYRSDKNRLVKHSRAGLLTDVAGHCVFFTRAEGVEFLAQAAERRVA